jgi:benzoyl-CoA reductase/2-hydroxyglutaryl-CoA dehydratase subunit BcrC/BadD/HgdB
MGHKGSGSAELWKEYVEKYERRIKRITENPNPTMFKSNKVLYQLMLNQARRELAAWESGSRTPVLYAEGNAPLRIPMALGFRTYWTEGFADRLTKEQAAHYFQLARRLGFPENTCDRVQLAAAVGVCGDLPAPAMVFTEQSECDPMAQACLWMGRFWRVPSFAVDVPFEQDMEAIRYVEAQLWEFIHLAEETFPDAAKYDEAKLIQLQLWEMDCMAYEKDILELGKPKPCPIAGRDALRMPPRQLYDDPGVRDYFRALRDELRERVAQGRGAVKDNIERFRVFWMCSAPFYEDPFSFLEERGCAVPLYEEGPGVSTRYCPQDEEDAIQRFGQRPENPVQEEAAALVTGHWSAGADRRADEVVNLSREYGVEGIVHFMQPGCLTCNNMAKLLGLRAEAELGIKNLYIEGWAQDLEKHNEAEFEAKLEDWLRVCLAEKETEKEHQ